MFLKIKTRSNDAHIFCMYLHHEKDKYNIIVKMSNGKRLLLKSFNEDKKSAAEQDFISLVLEVKRLFQEGNSLHTITYRILE